MDNIYFFRILTLKDVKIFHSQKRHSGEFIGYLGFIDFNKPSTLNDFPCLKEVKDYE